MGMDDNGYEEIIERQRKKIKLCQTLLRSAGKKLKKEKEEKEKILKDMDIKADQHTIELLQKDVIISNIKKQLKKIIGSDDDSRKQ